MKDGELDCSLRWRIFSLNGPLPFRNFNGFPIKKKGGQLKMKLFSYI